MNSTSPATTSESSPGSVESTLPPKASGSSGSTARVDERIIKLIRYGVLNNDITCLEKSLLRISRGCREHAFEIVRAAVCRYEGITPEMVTDWHIDSGIAWLFGGCEYDGWSYLTKKELEEADKAAKETLKAKQATP